MLGFFVSLTAVDLVLYIAPSFVSRQVSRPFSHCLFARWRVFETTSFLPRVLVPIVQP